MPDTITANHTVAIEDVEYQKGMLARLYRPSGAGPFPVALQVHGGAWTSKDRTDNDFMAKALAESGIFVASIDFRMPPVTPRIRARSRTSISASAGSRRMRASSRAGRNGSARGAHRVAGTRCCSRQCAP
jgi:predicted alpha/beta-hydrolase family hydrolase